jgi:AhpD family alkylhydroperoxidase
VHLVGPGEAPILARPYFAADGETSPIVGALAQVPELLPVTMPFLAQILGPSAIGMRAKEIVILRVSAQARCTYCVGAHTVAAADAGLSLDELEGLRGERALDGLFAGGEHALVELSDAIAEGGALSAEASERLRSAYGDHGLVELALLASTTLMLNRFCTTLRLPLGAATRRRLSELGAAG